MRCPSCGKVYPANEKMCNLCEEKLVSEAVYSNRMSAARQKAKEANIPKCPTCGSTNIRHISSTERGVNAVMFGFFGNKRKCQFECLNPNCKYRW